MWCLTSALGSLIKQPATHKHTRSSCAPVSLRWLYRRCTRTGTVLRTQVREEVPGVACVGQLIRHLLLQERKPTIEARQHFSTTYRMEISRLDHVWLCAASYLQMLSASHSTDTYSGWSFTLSPHILRILDKPVSSRRSLKYFVQEVLTCSESFGCAQTNPTETEELAGQKVFTVITVISEQGKRWQMERRSCKLGPLGVMVNSL